MSVRKSLYGHPLIRVDRSFILKLALGSLLSLLVSALINLPALNLYISGDRHDLDLLSDDDEPIYLTRPFLVAENRSLYGFYHEYANAKQSLADNSPQYNYWVDRFVGQLGLALALSPLELGLLLDLLLCLITFPITASLARLLGASSIRAYIAAAIFLGLPHLFSPYGLGLNITLNIPHIIDPGNLAPSSLPIQRGVYTQISLPFFISSITVLFSALRKNSMSLLILSALLSAICAHIYFFAWGSILCIATLIFLFTLLFRPFRYFKKTLQFFGTYLVVHTGLAYPALSLMSRSSSKLELDRLDLSSFTYVSTFVLLVLALMAILQIRSGFLSHLRSSSVYLLILVCLISELILMNSQSILNQFIAPNSFAKHYLQPLFTLCLTIIFISPRLAWPIRKLFPTQLVLLCRIVGGMLSFVFLIHFLLLTFKTHSSIESKFSRYNYNKLELAELLKYIEHETPKDSVFAISVLSNDYHNSFATSPLPNIIYFFTGRKILFQEWSINTKLPAAEQIAREVLLQKLLTGQPIEELLKADYYTPISLPGDLFSGTWTFLRLNKRALWSKLKTPSFDREFCDSLKTLKIDYVILEDLHLPNHSIIWSTPFKSYQIAIVDPSQLSSSFCDN